MEQLFKLGGDHVRAEVAFAVLRVIEESCDEEMQQGIVNLYIDLAQTGNRLSDVFVMVIVRVIGMFGDLSGEYELDFISLLLCDLADAYEGPRAWTLNALVHVCAKLEKFPRQVVDVFENYKNSRSIIVQEICMEALVLLKNRDVLMVTTETTVEFDEEMTFLDGFVQAAIAKGGKSYVPLESRDIDIIAAPKATLKFTYDESVQEIYGPDGILITYPTSERDESGLNTTGVKSVWGEHGLAEEIEAELDTPDSTTTTGPELSLFRKLSMSHIKR
jgi:AP-4 complex subunit epsilon-1